MADVNRSPEIAVVTTTVGSMDDATRVARAIVDRRLGACVQLDAIAASFYVWDGKLCAESEVRLTIKTVHDRLAQLEDFFAQEHPYDLPQFAVTAMAASPDYGAWVAANAGGGP
jgi:periplasmic divalent cation tolerance protein